jgi:hypothetical protein
MRSTWVTCAAAAVVALLIGACAGGGDEIAGDVTSTVAPEPTTGDDTTTVTGPAAAISETTTTTQATTTVPAPVSSGDCATLPAEIMFCPLPLPDGFDEEETVAEWQRFADIFELRIRGRRGEDYLSINIDPGGEASDAIDTCAGRNFSNELVIPMQTRRSPGGVEFLYCRTTFDFDGGAGPSVTEWIQWPVGDSALSASLTSAANQRVVPPEPFSDDDLHLIVDGWSQR